jgi:hypothetical protein
MPSCWYGRSANAGAVTREGVTVIGVRSDRHDACYFLGKQKLEGS